MGDLYRVDFEKDGTPHCRCFADFRDAFLFASEIGATVISKQIDGKFVPMDVVFA